MKDQQARKVELTGQSSLSPMRQLLGQKGGSSKNAATDGGRTDSYAGQDQGGQKKPSAPGGFLTAPRPGSAAPIGAGKSRLPNPYDRSTTTTTAITNPMYGKAEEMGQGGSASSSHQAHNLYGVAPVFSEQQMLLAPPVQSKYLEQREEASMEVEKTILELGNLFTRLGSLLGEQQEMIERIDEDVEMALEDSEAGKEQLMKAYESANSNQTLYWKLGGVATVFTFFFTVFLL